MGYLPEREREIVTEKEKQNLQLREFILSPLKISTLQQGPSKMTVVGCLHCRAFRMYLLVLQSTIPLIVIYVSILYSGYLLYTLCFLQIYLLKSNSKAHRQGLNHKNQKKPP